MNCRAAAMAALRSAAFEERVNKHREAADWWRARAALWFRREYEESNMTAKLIKELNNAKPTR